MGSRFELPSHLNVNRWAKLAIARLDHAVRTFLGMDLLEDGAVRIHGSGETRPTVGMIGPFGPIAHHIQVLRADPRTLLRFYDAYTQACARAGRGAESFAGQVEAFGVAMEAVPLPRPRLARVA